MTASSYPHIDFDAKGTPIVAGTTMKIVEIVMAQRAHGWSPEELSLQFPHLSMADIDAALAYYRDHKSELDLDIESRSEFADESRSQSGSSRVAQRPAGLKRQR